MGVREQVTPEQWKSLLNAPSAAAEYVATASGGGLDVISELITSIRIVTETATREGGSGFGKLVDDVLAEMAGMSLNDAKTGSIKYDGRNMAAMREQAKQIVGDAGRVVTPLDGGDGYKRWLLYVARKVAETKTGGIMGIGGISLIDAKEKAALDELKALLGVVEM